MGDVHIAGFSEGMNRDLSKTKLPANAYYDAQNFRVTTDKGLSTFDLENIKGNTNLAGTLTFPELDNVAQITIITTSPGNVNITISGATYYNIGSVPFTVSASTTPEDMWRYIQTDIGYTERDIKYKVYFNDLYLLVNSLDITETFNVASNAPRAVVDLAFIPKPVGPIEVIGSTYIGDNIYVLTTDNTTTEPGRTDPSSYGQIWRVTVNKTVEPFVASIELIYFNKLNFSTYNPIAPSAIEGRYETQAIQRIYWTDFYNKLRSINVVNPQAFALDPSVLDVAPAVDYDVPILQTIYNNGTTPIEVGMYQVAYRLSNVTGAVTGFSTLSNMVFVVGADENNNTGSSNFKDYFGEPQGTTTNKQITWKIDNLDRSFERIEIALYFKKNISDAGVFNLIIEDNISNDSFTFTYNGAQVKTPLTISEFLLGSNSFTHCKTITTKNNRLIAGNVRNDQADIAITDFDARAYRWTAGPGQVMSITEDGVPTQYLLADLDDINETSDAINTDPNIYRYQSDGVTLGGEGLNIKYEFYTVDIAAEFDQGAGNFDTPDLTSAPWRVTSTRQPGANTPLDLNVISPTNSSGTSIQSYPTPVFNLNDGFKYPNISGFYRGYQRNETYRFAIQFFDKSKNPLFTKWIGDIKFPDFDDINNNAFYEDGTPYGIVTDFRPSQASIVGVDLIAYVRSLGIQFTVTGLQGISDQICGYSIVRVERSINDRTVVAQGYIKPINVDSGQYYTTTPNPTATIQYPTPNTDGNEGNSPADYDKGFFITPEIMNLQIVPTSGMTLKIKGQLLNSNNKVYVNLATAPTIFGLFKSYDWVPFTSQVDKNIDHIISMDYGGEGNDGTTLVHNYDFETSTTSYALGNRAFYFRCDSVISYPASVGDYLLPNLAVGGLLLTNIERTLSNQYGGNTYGARADNEYISCSHFRPIRTSAVAITDTFQLFGGDIFMNLYDSHRWAKNWGSYISRGTAVDKYSSTFYFPVESVINTDLRYGIIPSNSNLGYINKDLNSGTTKEFLEAYGYNSVYSCENNVIKYFPKPDPYIINNEFVNRFHISDVKTNGELVDSWAIFDPLEYWDVDGSNGPITACGSLANEIYFAQHSAFGRLLVQPKASISAQDGTELRMGTGGLLDSHQYYSVETGSKHQFSWLKTEFDIMFFDIRHKKIFSFNPSKSLEPISDIKGMNSWLRSNVKGKLEISDKPTYNDPSTGINGIHGTFDYLNGELIYTVLQGNEESQNDNTLVYSQKLGKFTAFYGHTPKIYVTNNQDFLSAGEDTEKLWLHNYGEFGRFYDNYVDSSITYFANKNPDYTKIFTNYEFETEMQDGSTLVDIASGLTPIQDTFNSLEASTDFQSNTVPLVSESNLKRRFRTWRTEVPTNSTPAAYVSSGFFARMRDKYLKTKFSFTNNGDKRFIVHSILTYFSINKPK